MEHNWFSLISLLRITMVWLGFNNLDFTYWHTGILPFFLGDCEEFFVACFTCKRRPAVQSRLQRLWHLTFAPLPRDQLSPAIREVLKTSASSGIRKQVRYYYYYYYLFTARVTSSSLNYGTIQY
jgi:hypothetical protein